jgi:hypothetical protein
LVNAAAARVIGVEAETVEEEEASRCEAGEIGSVETWGKAKEDEEGE